MNKERLLNVARALRESPNPERFSMLTFAHDCGSPACALGHYGYRRDLQDAFYIDDDSSLRTTNGSLYCIATAGIHFDVSQQQAENLFEIGGCGNAQTAIEAAEYIEKFVADHGGLS